MTNIIIVYDEASSAVPKSRDKRKLSGDRKTAPKADSPVRYVPAEKLRSNFEELVKALAKTLTMPDSIGSFEVEALDIELELTAEGQIGLLGTGGKVGGKGSLTLRLKHSKGA
jgi:hypothetical protein